MMNLSYTIGYTLGTISFLEDFKTSRVQISNNC